MDPQEAALASGSYGASWRITNGGVTPSASRRNARILEEAFRARKR